MKQKGRVLFVDDEKRVLNSMRGMFRRDYDLFLTTEGDTAVEIAADKDVDVVVADQRMPGMTGVEVLEKVRQVSPRTIRILLTGYADPSAIQSSINKGEVFRFLSKPCSPKLLRETISIAVEAARVDERFAEDIPDLKDALMSPQATPEPAPPLRSPPPDHVRAAAIEPPTPQAAADRSEAPRAQNDWPEPAERESQAGDDIDTSRRTRLRAGSVGLVVYTNDAEFSGTVAEIIDSGRPLIVASSLNEVTAALEQRRAGIFLTDATEDADFLHKLIGALKKHLPEVVTIVVSDSRDANDMIRLINYGQVYRYAVKPLEALTLRTDVNAAVLKHLQLLNHPEMVERHKVIESSDPEDTSSTLNRFIGKMARLRQLWAVDPGKLH